jgi:hypothetical protein
MACAKHCLRIAPSPRPCLGCSSASGCKRNMCTPGAKMARSTGRWSFWMSPNTRPCGGRTVSTGARNCPSQERCPGRSGCSLNRPGRTGCAQSNRQASHLLPETANRRRCWGSTGLNGCPHRPGFVRQIGLRVAPPCQRPSFRGALAAARSRRCTCGGTDLLPPVFLSWPRLMRATSATVGGLPASTGFLLMVFPR